MENTNPDPIDNVINFWKAAPRGKKILLVVAGFILTLIGLFIWSSMNMMSSSTGLAPSYQDSYNGLSIPNTLDSAKINTAERSPVIDSDYVAGQDAEAFETKDYNARIETSNLDSTCDVIGELKPKPGVVFLSAVNSKTSCSFQFKVTNAETEAVLTVIKNLDPKELSQNIYTIKKQLENSLNQRDILTQNLASTEQILADALLAYDNLLATAVAEKNSTALTTAVRDKIELIDMLKQRREQTRQQIDYLNQQLAEQTDRLEYTYFSVYVLEQKYFNLEQIIESWKYEFRNFINSINEITQGITLGLLSFVLYALLYAMYVVIVLIIAKLGWRIVRRIWQN